MQGFLAESQSCRSYETMFDVRAPHTSGYHTLALAAGDNDYQNNRNVKE